MNNLDKENRFNEPEKAEEIEHYEESRDQLSGVNVSNSSEQQIIDLISTMVPLMIIVSIVMGVLSACFRGGTV